MKSFMATMLLALALAGCAGNPEYTDPLAGLTSIPAASVPQDVPVTVEQPVALVPSENSARLLNFAQQFKDDKLLQALVPPTLQADGDPQYLVNGAVNVLRRRYPGMVLVEDLRTARQRGFRTTFVMDIQAHHLVTAFDRNQIHLTVIAMDASQRPVSRIVAEGASGTTYGSMDAHFRDAVAMAVGNLEAKTARLLN